MKTKQLASERLSLTSEYYFSIKLKEIRERSARGEDIINLAIGSPDLLPDVRVAEWLAEFAQSEGANKYSPYSGQEAFVQSIQRFHQTEFKTDLPHNQILPLMGSKEGVFYAHFALLNTGDEIIVPDPGYLAYTATATMLGATVKTYEASSELTEIQVLDSIMLKLTERTKIVWFTQPHMPTGRIWSSDFQSQLLQLCVEHQVVLISDMPYAQIVDQEVESLTSIAQPSDWYIELHSMSKNFNMAGWRLGWVVGNPAIINLILNSKSNVDSGQYAPLQLTAARVLDHSRAIAEQTKEVYKVRRKKAEALLETLGARVLENQHGMFVWAKLPTAESVQVSEALLTESHIFIPPGDIFGHNGKGYLRVSLCSPESHFDKAINRLTTKNKEVWTTAG